MADKTKHQQQKTPSNAGQKALNQPQQKQNAQNPKQNPSSKKPGSNW